MQTFDQALLHHVQAGRVTMAEALKAYTHPRDFKLLVSSDGQRHLGGVGVRRGSRTGRVSRAELSP